MEPGSYQIQEGDVIETRNFYTVGQVAEFMDVEVDMDHDILVNNREADFGTLVYENFSIEWTVLSFGVADEPYEKPVMNIPEESEVVLNEDGLQDEAVATPQMTAQPETTAITVYVNGEPVPMSGKKDYIFVDIFDRITFDLAAGGGRAIATLINGQDAAFSEKLHDGDQVDLYWKEN